MENKRAITTKEIREEVIKIMKINVQFVNSKRIFMKLIILYRWLRMEQMILKIYNLYVKHVIKINVSMK